MGTPNFTLSLPETVGTSRFEVTLRLDDEPVLTQHWQFDKDFRYVHPILYEHQRQHFNERPSSITQFEIKLNQIAFLNRLLEKMIQFHVIKTEFEERTRKKLQNEQKARETAFALINTLPRTPR